MHKKLLKEFIRQFINESQPQAPADAPLGQYAFPTKRKAENLPQEPDTEYEKMLFKALQRHFEGKHLSQEHIFKIQNFLKNGWYSNLFSPPSQEVIYRGTARSTSELKEMLGSKKKPDLDGESDVAYEYVPMSRSASSWTTDINVAWEFAESIAEQHPDTPWRVVLFASTSENPDLFVSCRPGITGNGIYGLDDVVHSGLMNEEEVIALGNIAVNHVAWYKPSKQED